MGSFAATGVDYAISLVIVLLTVVGSTLLARPLKLNPVMAGAIVLTSLVFAYAKYINTLVDGSDSMGYYLRSLGFVEADLGTDSIRFLTSLFTQGFGLAFLPTNMIYGAAGAIGSLLFYAAFVQSCALRPRLWEQAVFFGLIVVAVGFWGGGIGKDALALLGSSMFCLAVTSARPRMVLIGVGIVLMLMVRPHIAAAMMGGLGVAVWLAKDLPLRARVPLLVLTGIGVMVMVPLVLVYVGLDQGAGLSDLQENIEDRTNNFSASSGFVDVSNLSWPLRMLSYLFRPLPYEAASATQLIASGQNLLLLVVVGALLWQARSAGGRWRGFAPLALLMFGLAAWLPLGLGTSNLGISMRQKWMFVPAVLLALVRLRSWAQVRGHVGWAAQSTVPGAGLRPAE